jgi:hypothetical protein
MIELKSKGGWLSLFFLFLGKKVIIMETFLGFIREMLKEIVLEIITYFIRKNVRESEKTTLRCRKQTWAVLMKINFNNHHCKNKNWEYKKNERAIV